MNTVLIGVLSIVLLLILIFLHMPISIVMVVVGTIGYALVVSPQAALIKLGTDTFNNAASYTLSVIPMFLLMGLFLGTSGLARRLFEAFNAWLGHIRGGLAIASIAACAFFAAVSGSNIGTAATIGKVAVPEMRIHKYKDSLSAGCVAAGLWGSYGGIYRETADLGNPSRNLNRCAVSLCCLVAGQIKSQPGTYRQIFALYYKDEDVKSNLAGTGYLCHFHGRDLAGGIYGHRRRRDRGLSFFGLCFYNKTIEQEGA